MPHLRTTNSITSLTFKGMPFSSTFLAVLFPASGEERNDFVLKVLWVLPAAVADIFMIPTSQLLHLKFFEEEQYLAALEHPQTGVPGPQLGVA